MKCSCEFCWNKNTCMHSHTRRSTVQRKNITTNRWQKMIVASKTYKSFLVHLFRIHSSRSAVFVTPTTVFFLSFAPRLVSSIRFRRSSLSELYFAQRSSEWQTNYKLKTAMRRNQLATLFCSFLNNFVRRLSEEMKCAIEKWYEFWTHTGGHQTSWVSVQSRIEYTFFYMAELRT